MASMKRSMASDDSLSGDDALKKIKFQTQAQKSESTADLETEHHGTGFASLDGNLLYEILKHVDGRSLAMASCVSKIWNRTALDERLWELICTRHCAQVGCGKQQLRSVVLALGGFRRLYSLYLWPLSKQPPSSASCLPVPRTTTALLLKTPIENNTARFGKDEVQLSLSLLSIRFFENMNFPVKDK